MTAFMLLLEEFKSFGLAQAPAGPGLMFQDEIRKGLPNDHAYLRRLAVLRSGMTTAAFMNNDIRRSLQQKLAGCRIGDDLFQIT